MGSNKIDRIGERSFNSFGSEMIITGYKKWDNVDVYFPQYDWTFKGARYGEFKKGNIKCPYDKSVYGVGYIGEGEYKVSENGRTTKCYNVWRGMLRRCYDEEFHKKKPTYKGCSAYEEWLNFQNFAKWYDKNYYEIDGEKMCLDKDILVKHNKIYSPETCIFVPERINTLFTKKNKNRGDNPIGVSYHKRDDVYEAQCNLINPETGKSKKEYLGLYDTKEKAFEVYKYYKEKNIKMVADYFRTQIPENLYNAMYNYIVEITD